MINIAVLGFGTVGSGVVELLNKNSASIASKADDEIRIKYILDVRDFPDSPFGNLIIHDFETILNDPDIKVVVEVIGGIEPAYTFTKRCLHNLKHVVTSNKELVATHGDELLAIAKKNNLNYLFEASVGGGIPVIRPLNQCLAANEVKEIVAILNGTTNYILTKMIKERQSFEEALSEAQRLGYAERNPKADIEGIDACRKISILASLAYGRHVDPDKVHTEGITNIKLEDVEYAKSDGRVIKLLGRAVQMEGSRVFVMVCPTMIPLSHPLANVEDVFNGVLVYGDAIGDVMFYGRGAGKMPTASAVVADIIDVCKHFPRRRWFYWERSTENFLVDYKEFETKYYIRAKCDSIDEALETADRSFGHCHDISANSKYHDEVVFITPLKKEGELITSLDAFKSDPHVKELVSVIRVLEEGE